MGARISVSLAGGALCGLAACALVQDGAALAIRYAIGVTIAHRRGDLPPRPARFLAWAYQAGILRISGTAYQFRH